MEIQIQVINYLICNILNTINNNIKLIFSFLAAIPETEILAMRDKTNRHLRLRELLLEHSLEASMVVMTLPMPRKNMISAPLYMAWLELLTRDMPPFLLVRGNQTSVLTFYS